MVNQSLRDNYLKIGKTTKSPEERAESLSSTTSIPTEFEVVYSHRFQNCHWAEDEAKKRLANFRVNKKREFFECTIEQAKCIILEIAVIEREKEVEKYKFDESRIQGLAKEKNYLIVRWSNFFKRLNWSFSIPNQNKDSLLPDLILHTKYLKDIPEEYGGQKIYKIDTFIHIEANLPSDFGSDIEREYLTNLAREYITQQKNLRRIILVGSSPIKNFESVYLGWQFMGREWYHENWERIRFIQHFDELSPKFGILDDNEFWKCIIRGNGLTRENFVVENNELLKIWNQT